MSSETAIQPTPVTLKELGINTTDRRGVSISTTNIHLEKKSIGKQDNYTAVVEHPLEGAEFVALLNNISPAKGFNRGGILSDWNMPKQKTQDDKDLYRLHTGLGEVWKQFLPHLPLLYQAVDAGLAELLSDINVRVVTPDQILSNANLDNPYSLRYLLSGQSPHVAQIRKDLLHFIRQHPDGEAFRARNTTRRKQVHYRELSPIEALDRMTKWPKDRVSTVIGDYVSQLDQGLKLKLTERYLHKDPTAVTVRRADDQEFFIASRSHYGYGYPLNVKTTDEGFRIRVGNTFQADGRFINDDRGNTITQVVEGSAAYTGFAIPTIRWNRDQETGERSYQFDGLSEAEVAKHLPLVENRLHPDLTFEPNQFNPLVGLMTVAYFTPEVTNGWPSSMKLSGSKIDQAMGAPQVPVLAMIRQRDILKSPFFEKVEEHFTR